MSARRPDPLTAEERALADRLGRVAPRGGPSPQLDAAILAAARRPRVRPLAPGSRWPAIVGLAASLGLAVGIGWQLRPQPEPVAAEAPRESRPAAAASPNSGSEAATIRRQAPPMAQVATEQARQTGQPDHDRRESVTPRIAAEPAPQAPPASIRAKAAPASAATRSTAAAAVPAGDPLTGSASVTSSAPAAPAVITAPVPAAVAPVATDGPPLQSAPAPGTGPTRRAAARASSATSDASAPPQAKRLARPAQSAVVFDDSTSPAATIGIDAWPVEQDWELPLDAWFERIRQRRDGGDPAGARASLDLLRQVHPDAALPEDLRVWAAEAPPAQPERDETGPTDRR